MKDEYDFSQGIRGPVLVKRFYWYVCHGCQQEYSLAEGVRPWAGCANLACQYPDIHTHSNADGELPKTLAVPEDCRGRSE